MPSLEAGSNVFLVVIEQQALLVVLGRCCFHIVGEGDNVIILLTHVSHDVKVPRIHVAFPKPV
jgi:hypothetical protein